MIANPWRGEVDIMLGGRYCVLIPCFSALCKIEVRLGLGLFALAEKLAKRRITLEELCVIVAFCLEEPHGVTEIGQMLLQGELAQAVEAVSRMFTLILERSEAG